MEPPGRSASRPRWLGSREGFSDEVLPPWTPLTLSRRGDDCVRVRCWGREHGFSPASVFPVEIRSAGRPLLAGPVRAIGRVGGRQVEWTGGPVQVQSEAPASVVLSAQGNGSPRLHARTTLEYDGMLRVDWGIEVDSPTPIEALVVEVPIPREHARYLYHYPGRWGESYNARALPQEGLAAPFRPLIWLGDEERGLAWFCESENNWFPADPDRAVEILPQPNCVLLRLNLVGRPVLVTPETAEAHEGADAQPAPQGSPQVAGLRYTFGFQATPVKPNAEDVWDWRICHGGDYGIERLDPEAPATLRYPAEGNILLSEGTVELYVQPLPRAEPAIKEQCLFALELPRGDEVRWYWPDGGASMRLLVRQQQDRIVELETWPAWLPDRFHHVALTWGETIRVYHDGELLAEAPRRGLFVGSLEGGVIRFGGPGGHLLLDEVRISRRPRSPEELKATACADAPPTLDDDTLLLDHLDEAFEPGIIEHLDGGYGGYSSTRSARAAGNWGWNGRPGGIVGLGRFRRGRFGNALELGLRRPPIDDLAEMGVRTLCIHEQWTDAEGYFDTTHREKLRSLVQACHQRGMRLLVYLGFLLSDVADEWAEFSEECLVEPHQGYDPYDYPPQPHQRALYVCYASVWQDAIADGIGQLMDEFDIDGVYLDGTANPWACTNRRHGCGYVRPDGTVAPTYSIFATRQMMRRIYTVVKSRKPYGQVNVHQSTCMTIPTLSWATSYWDGEQFGSIEPGRFALETIPLDAFRTEFMGHPWGVPAEFLCYDRPYTHEQALAFTLPHDVLVRPNGLGPHLETASRLWRAAGEFGRHEAEWLPYWRNEDFVTVAPQGAVVSLYRHPANGVLAVVSNLAPVPTEVRVSLKLDRLGLPADCRVRDALTGEELAMAEGTLSVALPSLGWRLVRIGGK